MDNSVRRPHIDRWLKPVAIAAAIGMFIVLLMGATVTNTGSAEGCGKSWPLCHGQFIPEFAVTTAIEYSHRMVTGIVGLMIAALSIGVLLYWRRRREIIVLVPVMIGFLLLQSALGALAVLYPKTPGVMALHFGISLISFASVFLTAMFIHEQGETDARRDVHLPLGFRWAVWGTIVFVYGVVYLGAYVRHTGASLSCVGWPLCNGQVFPGLDGPVGVAFLHRIAALASVLLIGAIAVWAWRFRASRPEVAWAGVAALGLVLLQSLSGAVVVFSQLALFSALAHAGIMTLLFGALSYLCLHALPRPAAATALDAQPAPAPSLASRTT